MPRIVIAAAVAAALLSGATAPAASGGTLTGPSGPASPSR